jgi:molybdopterin-guanine dinucleotide biosynthesis protein A
MGRDKAGIVLGGVTLAERAAAVLRVVAAPVVEVGPGHTGLPAVTETPAGSGPLAAVVAGASALADGGHRGPVLVVAVDMPRVNVELLALLAGHPSTDSVVPVAGGRPQPLCARWAPSALVRAGDLVAAGERSMQALLDAVPVTYLPEHEWTAVAGADALVDVDTPADLDRVTR